MSTAIGIKKGGVNISTCNVIYWSVVLPTLCFGCEVWFIKKRDIDTLLAFQRYAARRIQRLHTRSLNVTSAVCLGWMSLINYIKARKLIFIRTIAVMAEYFPLRNILFERANEYNRDDLNPTESPLVQILHFCDEFGLLEQVVQMVRGCIPSKGVWKRLVWERAWKVESDYWHEQMDSDHKLDIVRMVSPLPAYSVWWSLSDSDHRYMRRCEVMVKLLCRASLLKNHDGRLRNAPFGARMCLLCQNAAYEDTMHLVSQCQFHHEARKSMLESIGQMAVFDGLDVFSIALGKYIEGWSFEEMTPIWKVTCTYINGMYRDVLKFHKKYNLDNKE